MSLAGVPDAALAAIWARHTEHVLARLDAIDRGTAVDSSREARQEAIGAAHQLAGTVGTFGFTRGTELARQIEARLGVTGAHSPALCVSARELRRELTGTVGDAPATPRHRAQ